jgi:hypothetical protein
MVHCSANNLARTESQIIGNNIGSIGLQILIACIGMATIFDILKTRCKQYWNLIVDQILVRYRIVNIGTIMGMGTKSHIVKTGFTQYWNQIVHPILVIYRIADIGKIMGMITIFDIIKTRWNQY